MSVVSSDVPHSIFPLSVDGLSEVRIAVHPDDADEAQRIIESHRTELKNGQVVRLRDEFETLQQAIGYRFRDRGLLEHAMTHTSRANEDVSGGVVDNESMEFLGDAVLGFVVADMLFREFPRFDEGQKSKTKAALVSTATLARQAERLGLGDHLLLGPRRGEDRRPPEAGAARRQLRGAASPRSISTAASSTRAPSSCASSRRCSTRCAATASAGRTTSRRCRSCCSRATCRCRSTAWSARRARITASCSRSRSVVSGEPLAAATGREQEGSGAGSGARCARETQNVDVDVYDFVRDA